MNELTPSERAAQDLREALEIDDIPAEVPPSFPGKYYYLLEALSDSRLRDACLVISDDFPNFLTWPAAISHHHNREGGLLQHTIEVAEIALHIAEKFPAVNHDVLIAAALWHDFGKLFEYQVLAYTGHHEITSYMLQKDAYGETTEYWERDKKAVHHCISSAQEFIVAARAAGVDKATEDAVVHCILSHHGPVKEWGSPVAPESLEAIILHQADYLSAKHGATK